MLGAQQVLQGRLAVSQSLNLPLPSRPRWLSLCGGGGVGRSHTERAAGSAGASEAPPQGSEPGLCLVTTSEPRAGTPRFLRGVPRREEEQWRAAW